MSDSIIRSLASGRGSILIFAALIMSSGEALAGSEVCVVLPPGYTQDKNGNLTPESPGNKLLTQAALEAGIPAITIIDGYWAINGIKTGTTATGDTGDQGATGPQGATGAAGAAGPKGNSGGTCSCKCTGTTS